MKKTLNILLIGFGCLPYMLVLTGARMSEFYGIWLDAGWLFICVGGINLASEKAEREAKAQAEAKRAWALREKAIREQVREEVIGERLLHSLN